jgi:hypothetical protein
MRLLFFLTLLISTAASADRGALSVDFAPALGASLMPSPFAAPAKTTLGTSAVASLGVRYALSHSLELAALGFFEPEVSYFHNGVVVRTNDGAFTGTLNHRVLRYGALMGARLVRGLVWRWSAGVGLGWTRRSYSGFVHIDDLSGTTPVSFGLSLPDFTADNLVLAPSLGLEWLAGDHWSLSVRPRLELWLGPESSAALIVPFIFSWSWFL